MVAHALAMFYSERNEFARAAQLEEQFASSAKADRDALGRAAGLYLNAGDIRSASKLAEQAYSQNPNAQNEALFGQVLMASGQSEQGTIHLANAWKSAKPDPRICFDYAQALLQQQDFAQAVGVLEEGLKSNPKNAQLILARGVALYGQRRFEDAIDAFLETIQMDPTIQQPYVFLGRVLDQASPRLNEITGAYRTWAHENPQNATALLLLAKALIAAGGQDKEAAQLLERSISLDSKNWESHYELGVLRSKQHNYAGAAAELTRAIELDPKQAMPHYHLARVYDRLGERDRAQDERAIHQRLTAPISSK